MTTPTAAPAAGPAPRARELLGDALLAAVLLLTGVVGTGPAGQHQPGSVPPDRWCYLLLVLAPLSLLVRRRWPLVTLAVATVVVSAYLVLGYPYGPILITYLIAVYTVAVRLPVRRAAIAAALSLVILLGHVFVSLGAAPGLVGVLPASAWAVVPFALGVTIRSTREATLRSRAEAARRQADDERLRIAQEVHDVVGHGLAAINMQAEIALHLLPKRPEQAETALTAISRTSREALDELRVTLTAVRHGADRGPAPGLAQVGALRDRLAGTGLPVTVETTGAVRGVPAAVDLAAYRVVQESLTNVLRHAGRAAVTVHLGYADDAVTVEVTDTGPTGAGGGGAGPAARGGPGAPGGSGDGVDVGRARPAEAGHGLAGMRERVTALGGAFEAGPVAGGGFRVFARLPAERRS